MVWFVVYYNKNVELSARESFLEYVPLVVITFWSFPHSWLITGCVARVTRRMSLVEQELLTVPEHLSSPLVFNEVHVTRSLVLCVCFVDRCLTFCPFFWPLCCLSFFDLRILISLWYLQTLLTLNSYTQSPKD